MTSLSVSPYFLQFLRVSIGQVTFPLSWPLTWHLTYVETTPGTRLPPLKAPQCWLPEISSSIFQTFLTSDMVVNTKLTYFLEATSLRDVKNTWFPLPLCVKLLDIQTHYEPSSTTVIKFDHSLFDCYDPGVVYWVSLKYSHVLDL